MNKVGGGLSVSHLTPSPFQTPKDSQQHTGWIVCLVAVAFPYHSWVCPVSLATSLCLNLPWQHSFVIADMTCPMDVAFHYVSSQRITGILGFVRHPRMAALRILLKWGCQEVVTVNKGMVMYAAL